MNKTKVLVFPLLLLLNTVFKWGDHSTYFAFSALLAFVFSVTFTCNGNQCNRITKIVCANKLVFFLLFHPVVTTIVNIIIGNVESVNYLYELFAFIFIVLFSATIYDEENEIKKSLCIACDFLTIFAIFGLYEYITKINVFVQHGFFSAYFLNTGRIASAYVNPMIHGYVMMIGFLMSIYCYKKGTKKKIVLFLIGSNIILTQTRSAWISLLLLGFLYLYRYISRKDKKIVLKKNTILTSLLALVVGLVTLNKTGMLEIISSRMSAIGKYTNNYQRTASIFYVIQVFSAKNLFYNVFGMGNHFSAKIMLSTVFEWQGFTTTDNYYLASIVNFGYLYIILYMLYFISSVREFVKSNNFFEMAIKGCIISSSIFFFFLEPFNYYPCAVLFFFMIGLDLTNSSLQYCKGNERNVVYATDKS